MLMLMQIKCFSNEDIYELENDVNEWLEEMCDISIFDCKYNVTSTFSENEYEDDIVLDESIIYSCLFLFRIE